MPNSKPMSRKRIYMTLLLFILGLTSFRIGWIFYHEEPDHPDAVQGAIDLRDAEFTDERTLSLDGEWAFYPGELIDPDNPENTPPPAFLNVPGDWREALPENGLTSAFGAGTYRLSVRLPEGTEGLFGLRINKAFSASSVFVNGMEIAKQNDASTNIHTSTLRGPYTGQFPISSENLDIIIHLSNYDLPFTGGLTESVEIGTTIAVVKESSSSTGLQLSIGVIYLLHSLYAFFIFFFAKSNYRKEVLFYGLLLVSSGISILIDDNVVFQLPISIEWSNSLLLFLFISTLWITLKFIQHLFGLKTRIYRYLTISYVVIVITILIVPFKLFPYLSIPLALFYIISLFVLFKDTIRVIRKGYPDAIFILLFIAAYLSNVGWGLAIKAGISKIPYYPFDFLLAILSIAVLLIVQHIRLVKQSEEQKIALQKADRMKDEFLANTSHELRNPLHGINNIAHTILLDEKEPLSETNRESLELLMKIGKQMAFTLNDLLDSLRLTGDDIRLDKSAVNVHSVASVALDMVQFLVYDKKVQLKMDIPASFPTVVADEHRLIQILFNLLHNAVKFTSEGTVTVSATHTEDEVTVFVQDTGIGMNSNMTDKVFDRYIQENPSLTSIGGVGLGLSICKQLVNLHGGVIWAESAPGEGSTFAFTLPLAQNDGIHLKENTMMVSKETVTSKDEVANEQTILSKTPRILVVDDDPINIRILKKLLRNNYEVTTAAGGNEALEVMTKASFDLLIIDVMMPNMSGYELTRMIRKRYTIAELPILLLTARSQPEDISTGFLAGANDYVAKPMDALSLQARVEALTNLRESIKEQNRMEAAWLQAQIRPHFLFNTLNTIASLAEIDSSRMTKLLHEFGDYLRQSFSTQNVQDLVPIEDEIALTQSYLYIEKERFGERLQVEWHVEEGDGRLIPPLSIQTLVENAVNHGVVRREEGGTIEITIVNEKNRFVVTIEDTGVGMSEAKIVELLSEEAGTKTGIGIPNTHRRLKRLFGEGLKMTSSEGKGTIVSFGIPYINLK